MEIANVKNNSFGLKLSLSMQEEYAKIHGARLTKKLMKKLSKVGSDKLIITDFNKISLMEPYNATTEIFGFPINLTEKKLMHIQEDLIEKAMYNAAQDGQLLPTAEKLKADYKGLIGIIKSTLCSSKLNTIDRNVVEYKAQHPLLYKLGFRPSTK